MELSPQLYHRLVRPKWFTNFYIHNNLRSHFNFTAKTVLDFGSGIGSNCSMFHPTCYIGLDVDQKRIDYAKRIYPTYSFQVLQGDHLPIQDQSIDYILIVAVLHHIPTTEVSNYLIEFQRILKPEGRIIGIEPCFFHKSSTNWFMSLFDKGKYIQSEEGYFDHFRKHDFEIEVLKRFKKLILYNELYFSAKQM